MEFGGNVVDVVRYDDDLPWSRQADGGGLSLQRLCPQTNGSLHYNWTAASPTPRAANADSQCPPTEPAPPSIAINEVNYHSTNGNDTLEYIELVNNTAQTVDLQGFEFVDGITFSFDESTPLAPGGFLVVCRNENAVRSAFGIGNTVGDYVGQLSNSGERVTLVDDNQNFVDSFRYGERGEWPVSADGLGFTLERISLDQPTDDPANWIDSGSGEFEPPTGWQDVSIIGTATSSRLYLYIKSPGEFLIDDVRLVKTTEPNVNLAPNFGFPSGLGTWSCTGNSLRESLEPGAGRYHLRRACASPHRRRQWHGFVQLSPCRSQRSAGSLPPASSTN